MTIGANDNLREDFAFGGSALALFGPVFLIFAFFALVWIGFFLSGAQGSALARLCLVGCGVATPVLLAHAALRQATVRVEIEPEALFAHRGFPSLELRRIEWEDISGVAVLRNASSALTGASTLVLTLTGGRRVVISDLADAEAAREAIAAQCAERALAGPGPANAVDDECRGRARKAG